MSKAVLKTSGREMHYVEITQAEEMPVLSVSEKAELVTSIELSQAQFKNGDYIELASDDIGQWLRTGLEEARQQRRDAK